MITMALTWVGLLASLVYGISLGNWWLIGITTWLIVGVWYSGSVMALFQYEHPISAASMYWKSCMYFIFYALLGPLMGKSGLTLKMLKNPHAGWTMPSLRSWRYARQIEHRARVARGEHLSIV